MKRRKIPWLIGSIMIASLVVLIMLQSTGLWKDFSIESSSDLVMLYALSGLNFAALVIFGFIFLRSIVKLVRERRTFTLGAQIKTRLLIYFCALSLMPIIAMAVFSYLFMNRALDRWFTQIPENVLRETQEMQRQSLLDRTTKFDQSVRMLAMAFEKSAPTDAELSSIAAAGSLVHIGVTDADGKTISSFQRELTSEERAELDPLLTNVGSGLVGDPAFRDGRGFDVALSTLSGGRTLVVVPDPFGERTLGKVVENSVREFEALKERQVTIRRVGLLTLGVLTFLLMFAASWIAFYVARGLTAPIKALAEGASEIAKGNLGHRVDVIAEDELAILVAAFNEMSAELDQKSAELNERRRYIETVLDSLPTGVISFDAKGRITTINDSAVAIFGIRSREIEQLTIEELGDANEVLRVLVARARRIGHASDQTVLRSASAADERTVAITASALAGDTGGVVLVVEDLSELIAAQRASAWQEVARRMAHEIKNPLTPIQLSAERIARRFERKNYAENGNIHTSEDRGQFGEVVRESTETILREVTSLKTMVDEFSRFARLPEIKLAPGDLAEVIRKTVASFEGREVQVEFAENGTLPDLELDAEQMKRVFVNLIDNAVEAFDRTQPSRKVTLTARHDLARDVIVTEVSDNGRGIAASDLQKLFLPYFSTKGRGTGLGLAIVKRIVTDHRGKINVVANQPTGAKFIIELPVNSHA